MLLSLLSNSVLLVAVAQAAPGWGPHPTASAGWAPPSWPSGHAVYNWSTPVPHGADFQPDHVLRITYQNVSIGCQSRTSVLVNGTNPGPELRLAPGRTSWIRVYNDMTEQNATTVCLYEISKLRLLMIPSTGMASVSARLSSPMARLKQANGRLHLYISLITKSARSLMMLVPTSTTPMLASNSSPRPDL